AKTGKVARLRDPNRNNVACISASGNVTYSTSAQSILSFSTTTPPPPPPGFVPGGGTTPIAPPPVVSPTGPLALIAPAAITLSGGACGKSRPVACSEVAAL